MKRYLVIALALVGVVCSLSAQNIDRIFAKDGSVYEGYISTQVPGKSIVVTAQSATLVVDAAVITDLKYQVKEISSLSTNMVAWLSKNRSGDVTAKVASLKVNGVQYNDVLVLEQGSRYKIMVFASSKFELKWGNIVKTTKIQKDASVIVDVVTLKNGKRFKGSITEQIIGVELKIKHDKNSVETVRLSDVLSIHSEVANNSDLWAKLPLLDKVELKNGSVLIGFISSRMMGSSIMFLTKESAVERSIPLAEIAKYHKLSNISSVEAKKPAETSAAPTETSAAPTETTTPTSTPEQKKTDKKQKASRWEQEEEAAKAAAKDEAAKDVAADIQATSGIKINERLATLNLVQTLDGVHYLVHDVVDLVAVGRNVRINLPTSLRSENMKIVKLAMYTVPGPESKKLPGWTDDDAESKVVPAYSIDSENSVDGRWNIEIKAENLTPGVYALLPLVGSSRCISFRVRK